MFRLEHDETACPKCGRPLSEWPLKRGNLCAPKDWVSCIRPVPQHDDKSAS